MEPLSPDISFVAAVDDEVEYEEDFEVLRTGVVRHAGARVTGL